MKALRLASLAMLLATPAAANDLYDYECRPDGSLVLTIFNGASRATDKELDTCAGTVVLAITVRAGWGPETYAVIDAPPGLIAYPAEIDVLDGEEATIAFLPGVS